MFCRKLKFILLLVIGLGLLLAEIPVFAQTLNTGLDYAQYTGLVDTDVRVIIARIINVALGFLGVAALALILYGGYVYMTAGGNEENIAKAKKILLNAAIGLAIILSAFAITRFVISKLTDAIIGGAMNQGGPPGGCVGENCFPPGGQTLFYAVTAPTGQQTIKNVTVSILFFGNFSAPAEYDAATVPPAAPNNLKIVKSDQLAAPGNFSLISTSRIDFNPTGSCLDPDNLANSDPSDTCFEKNTVYQVILTTDIKSTNGLSLECSVTHPCTFEFTTGERIDRNPPSINLILPGQGARLPVSANVDVSANYSDDAGVKLVSFFQGAAKIQDVPLNPPIISGQTVVSWFTGVSSPATYELKAIAGDVDNHETASASQTVQVLPAYCFDLVKNFDETGIDCGGVCGACVGQSCQTSQDCAGAYCDPATKTCAVRPKITNVDLKDGKPGNFITIFGNDFGNTPGQVIFRGNAGVGDDKIVSSFSCNGVSSWHDNYIVVKVPTNAVTGPLEMATSSLAGPLGRDATNDSWGPDFGNTVFTINSTARPGLCGVIPALAEPSAVIQVFGTQLGSTQGSSNINFGNFSSVVSSWSDTAVNTKTPVLPAQTLTVKAVVNSQSSNSLPFEILPPAPISALPHIYELSPTSGPKGAYLTIFGQNFGAATGRVTFKQGSDIFSAEPLPDYCGNPWSDTQIVVKVPASINIGNAEVKVERNIDHQTSDNSKIYTVDEDKKQANLCKITPDNGPKGAVVKLEGEGFAPSGTSDGRVFFPPSEAQYGSALSWTDNILSGISVPDWAVSGPVQTITYGDWSPSYFRSNSLYFKVAAPAASIGTGVKFAVYAWSFSTGREPVAPKVVEACGAGIVPSPTPSQLWQPSDNVCINAKIKLRFTTLIQEGSIEDDSLAVEICSNESCATTQRINGLGFSLSLSNGDLAVGYLDSATVPVFDTITLDLPSGQLAPNTWYRVRLNTTPAAIRSFVFDETGHENSALEAPLAAPYSFKFKTKNSAELCKLGSAVVSPDPYIASGFNKIYYSEANKSLYLVTAIADDNKCWALDDYDYDWIWNAGATAGASSIYASITNEKQGSPARGKPVQDLLTQSQETPVSGEKVWAKTISAGQTVSDSATLKIQVGRPRIVDQWPNCQNACINAAQGLKFNLPMQPGSVKYNLRAYDCGETNSACSGWIPYMLPDYGAGQFTPSADKQEFNFTIGQLILNHYYKFLIIGGPAGAKSEEGANLDSSQINDLYAGAAPAYSWIFKTKNDANACSVDRVEIQPPSAMVYWVGAEALYRGLPYGAKDECSPAIGQLLNAKDYNWSWSSAVPAVATVPSTNSFSFTSSTAVGDGTVVNKKQTTQIIGVAQSKTNQADFILQCGFSPIDAPCPNQGVNFGIGKNSCCYQRPTAGLFQPTVLSNVCPNTAIKVQFDQEMDEASFSSSTLGYYNMILAKATSTATCPAGAYLVDRKEKTPYGFWQKLVAYVSEFFGQPAQADIIYCAGDIDYSLGFETIVDSITNVTSTRASLLLEKPLIGLKDYKLLLTKDIKNAAGVSLENQADFYFATRQDLCKIDNLKISPQSWLFGTANEDKIFTAHAYFKSNVPGAPEQEIMPLAGYTWKYSWSNGDSSIIHLDVPGNYVTSTVVSALSKNGSTEAGVQALIMSDGLAPSTVGEVFAASSTVQVFICENPWPNDDFNVIHPEYGLGYVDAFETDDLILVGKGWSNLKLIYCRDYGLANNITDDLPELNTPTVLLHLNPAAPAPADPVFKEFFATFKLPSDPSLPQPNTIKEDKNSIGLRIYPNLEHLSLPNWYLKQPWIPKGAPMPTKVGDYEALQEGRTYYINGLNVDTAVNPNQVYSNVYVFSFSDNPIPETFTIVNDLLKNFALNVNVADKEIIKKLSNDLKRQQDLRLIADRLWQYYQVIGNYPVLTENPALGTYLPAYTNSKWKSWQGVLGNLLSYNLPIDPQNGFYGCASSTLFANGVNLGAFEEDTCWNAANSTFICPIGSHVYQYETTGGQEVKLKADFELPVSYTWVNALASPTSTITYQKQNSCNDMLEGVSGKCGDGVLGSGETCEIGQKQWVACVPAGVYADKQQQKCNDGNDLTKQCKEWENIGSCVPQGKCGDGQKQGPEVCDDGANNGKYGYCAKDCTLSSTITSWPSLKSEGYCGNSHEDIGKEVCDASALIGPSYFYYGWCNLDNLKACVFDSSSPPSFSSCPPLGEDICQRAGAKYNKDKTQSCSWDCQSRDYCGDGRVNNTKKSDNTPYEICEKSESCQVGICNLGPHIQKYCENNEQCWQNISCSMLDRVCSNNSGLTCVSDEDCDQIDECKVKRFCEGGFVDGGNCDPSDLNPCPGGGTCVVGKYCSYGFSSSADLRAGNRTCATDADCHASNTIVCLPQQPATCSNNPTKVCQTVDDCKQGIKCQDYQTGKRYCKAPGEKKYVKFFEPPVTGLPYFQDSTSTPPSDVYPDDNSKTCDWDKGGVSSYYANPTLSCLPFKAPELPPSPSQCGNGKIEAGEVCDDGADTGVICDPSQSPYPSCTYCAYGCQQVITVQNKYF